MPSGSPNLDTISEPLNDVFEANVLRFSIVSFKRCYDEYLLGFSSFFIEV